MSCRVRLKAGLLALCLVMPLIWSGCGESPVATDNQSEELVRATKSARAVNKSVKLNDGLTTTQIQSTSTYYYPAWGAFMGVAFPKSNVEGAVWLKDASFHASAFSVQGVKQKILLDMTASSGTTLEDIQVTFGPSGTEFVPNAELTLRIGGAVTVDQIKSVSHLAGDGTFIESIDTETDAQGRAFVVVNIRVPGFSRYGWGTGGGRYY